MVRGLCDQVPERKGYGHGIPIRLVHERPWTRPQEGKEGLSRMTFPFQIQEGGPGGDGGTLEDAASPNIRLGGDSGRHKGGQPFRLGPPERFRRKKKRPPSWDDSRILGGTVLERGG